MDGKLRYKDEYFMKQAISLAKKGIGNVSPNPIVGALLVKNHEVISKGYHKYYGGPHAEANAISKANSSVKGATMYVTLEPCSTYGKTAPCTDLIISSGIKRVVIGSIDPNPLHSGKGIAKLRRKKIEVVTGVLSEITSELNRTFNKYIKKKMPYVTVKAAITLDGKMATAKGDSKWISNELSRQYVHRMRARNDAVLIGYNTLMQDDPALNVRCGIKVMKQPYRIVIYNGEPISLSKKLLQPKNLSRTIFALSAKCPRRMIIKLRDLGVKVIKTPVRSGGIDCVFLLRKLASMDITSVMVEGGSKTITSFFDRRMIDKLVVFIAPKLIGGNNAVPLIGGLGIDAVKNAIKLDGLEIKRFGSDVMLEGYPVF